MAFDRYAYSLNNPVRYVDPSGHFPIVAALAFIGPVGWVAIGAVAVVAVVYYASGGPEAFAEGLTPAVESFSYQATQAANGIQALFAKGEYVPSGLNEAERNAYREAVHRYKKAFGLGAADNVSKQTLDKIAEGIKKGLSPRKAADEAPAPPEADD